MAEAFKGISGCFNKEIFVCFRLVQLRSAKERENNLAILYINTVDYLHTLFCLLKQQCIKVINQQERAMSVFVNDFDMNAIEVKPYTLSGCLRGDSKFQSINEDSPMAAFKNKDSMKSNLS